MKKAIWVLIVYICLALGILLMERCLWDHHYEKGANYINVIFAIEQGIYGIIPLLFLMKRGVNYTNASLYVVVSFVLTIAVWLVLTHHRSFLVSYVATLQGLIYVEVPHILGIFGAVSLIRWRSKKISI